jgi:hypothetical protein
MKGPIIMKIGKLDRSRLAHCLKIGTPRCSNATAEDRSDADRLGLMYGVQSERS